MRSYRMVVVLAMLAFLLAGGFAVSSSGARAGQASEDEQTIWKLEHEYWRLVQDNDLRGYSALWHKDFLGWPSVSTAPLRKDHITDWITSSTNKGLMFKSIEMKPGGAQVTGDIAVVYYRMTYQWSDKEGKGTPQTIRVTHTWLKMGKEWQIIGGMSAREPAAAQS